ncbi:MAG: hypothetical protein IJS47_03935 [Clostridia bacterium]|nr:hypothetical protein [Clostridia bacterium]
MKTLKALIALIVCGALVYFGVTRTLKKSKSPDEFKEIMEADGYRVSQIYKNKDNVEKAYAARKSDENYTWEIEYIDFDTEDNAIAHYNEEYDKLLKVTDKSYDRITKGINFAQYMIESKREYMSISRIGKTFVSSRVDSRAKTVVRDGITKAGYWLIIDD